MSDSRKEFETLVGPSESLRVMESLKRGASRRDVLKMLMAGGMQAALAGSLGIAPTGNIDPERRYPSMFEPIHGSAFDIMGKGLANPVGTFWSVVMLLEHLGEPAAARRVMLAIEAVTANPALHTRDLGGSATTAQVTQAVCDFLAAEQAQAA